MKGNPVTVTRVSFQDITHIKMKCPVALMLLRRKMLTFCEMRSLTWVVSAERRERMSPVGDTGVDGCRTAGSCQGRDMQRPYLTCVVLIKEGNFLPHQDSVEVISESEI